MNSDTSNSNRDRNTTLEPHPVDDDFEPYESVNDPASGKKVKSSTHYNK